MNTEALQSGWRWESEFKPVNNVWGLREFHGKLKAEEIEKVEMKRKMGWFYLFFEEDSGLQIAWHHILLSEIWVWARGNKICVGWVWPLQLQIDILTDNAFHGYGFAEEVQEDLDALKR